MIPFEELHLFAVNIILRQERPTEVDLRRAVSALYYGLFHELTNAGASLFAKGGPKLQSTTARAYDHRTMLNACRAYSQARTGPPPEPLASLVPNGPDPKLGSVARTFVRLQEARHTADYDLSTSISRQDAHDLLLLARAAHKDFGEVQNQPETIVFLAMLLLSDRWGRRG